MLTRVNRLLGFVGFCAVVWLGANTAWAQNSVAEFEKILREKAAFDENDFAALEQGQTVVRLLPVKDKREVAVSGLVSLQVPAEVFLHSFRENMVRQSNSAILEIGRFSATPTLDDLQTLTIEDRDLEDLKECVVGDCKLKLSAAMIERLQKEVDWEAPGYRVQATQLLKLMLLDYVRDYLARGDTALIEYNDKPEEIRLADEQRALMAASGYLNNVVPDFSRYLKGSAKSEMSVVENALVWSKIKFGLKPVLAINHIIIYKRQHGSGPQVLVSTKQIYANHYFDSSLALTAFVNIPGSSSGSYLFYENRSRADGLGGMFGKMKRAMVEGKAVDSLKSILESSKANLIARASSQNESTMAPVGRSGRRWRISRIQMFLLFCLISGFITLFTLSKYSWKSSITERAPH
jgi:hypothetical protein